MPGGSRSDTGKRGLTRVATTILIIIICFFVGSGIYYFINQTVASSPNNNTADITPPSIQDVRISSKTETSATIAWKTNEPSTSQVIVHDSSDVIITTTEIQEALVTNHSISLSGLQPGTTYQYTVISRDAAGNENTSEGNLVTSAKADDIPPTISGVNVSNITESSATITWNTDETATGQVNYGKTETYDNTTPLDSNLTNSHSVTLTGLDDGTTYNFQAISKDSNGNVATSAKQTFETPAAIPVGSQVGNRAPDFSLQNLEGQDVDVKLSDFQGKIVMINFWATWCEPCLKEMPFFQAISDNWSSEDLAILAIANNYEETIDSVNEFIEDEGYTFPVFYDSQGQAKSLYSTSIYPTTFFIDAEGIIRYIQFERFSDQAEIESRLNSLY